MKLILFIFFTIFSSIIQGNYCIAQSQKKQATKHKCTSYLIDMSSSKIKTKNLCFTVTQTDHIDANKYNRPGDQWDREKDYWKYRIQIFDYDNKTNNNTEASFYIYEDDAEKTQYHCLIENLDIKAIVYDKSRKSWQIVLLQNNKYSIISSYAGYKIIDAFKK